MYTSWSSLQWLSAALATASPHLLNRRLSIAFPRRLPSLSAIVASSFVKFRRLLSDGNLSDAHQRSRCPLLPTPSLDEDTSPPFEGSPLRNVAHHAMSPCNLAVGSAISQWGHCTLPRSASEVSDIAPYLAVRAKSPYLALHISFPFTSSPPSLTQYTASPHLTPASSVRPSPGQLTTPYPSPPLPTSSIPFYPTPPFRPPYFGSMTTWQPQPPHLALRKLRATPLLPTSPYANSVPTHSSPPRLTQTPCQPTPPHLALRQTPCHPTPLYPTSAPQLTSDFTRTFADFPL